MSSRVYVPPSSDTLFIRGFSYHHRVEDIKDFFFKEAGRCAVEFNKDDGNNGQYIALRFESREIAKDVYRRFNDREVLGDRITLTWYKELRKIRPITDPRRYAGRRDSYYGSDHYDHRNYQTSGGRSSHYKSHYAPGSSSAGLGRIRRFSRSSSRSRSISRSISQSRSSSRSYESGEVRGHRLKLCNPNICGRLLKTAFVKKFCRIEF
ncbi:hypothetical protein HELRODRAFT_163862 [Helobdella robusta]|uniref:RRM domain-containing protein n=1 Tax=Helobdella robusta TaxID=6412 RepID=T1EUJ8_HELRO|nr:hypothetical protein HELRODRAFT_163862 [Helobdella robusta]ESN96750.1 hypothetical protein HELRODRAFT_163862 [Helobdella robusta]